MAEDKKPAKHEKRYAGSSPSSGGEGVGRQSGAKGPEPENSTGPVRSSPAPNVTDEMSGIQDMAKRHLKEARDLHGQSRDALKDMHSRHEAEMKDIMSRMASAQPPGNEGDDTEADAPPAEDETA